MPIVRLDELNHLRIQPIADLIECFLYRERLRENSRSSRNPQERENHDPIKPDQLVAGQRFFEPLATNHMFYRVLVDGVQQDVGIDNLHWRSPIFWIMASSSISNASAVALVMSISGGPML